MYKNSTEKDFCENVRRWVHSIQLFFKSCPLFLLGCCFTLRWVPTCNNAVDFDWPRFGFSLLFGFVTAVLVAGAYGAFAFLFVCEQKKKLPKEYCPPATEAVSAKYAVGRTTSESNTARARGALKF